MDANEYKVVQRILSRVSRRVPHDLREEVVGEAWYQLLLSGRLAELGPVRAGFKYGRRAVRTVIQRLPREDSLPEEDGDGEIGPIEDPSPFEQAVLREVTSRMKSDELRVFTELYEDPSDRDGKIYGRSYREIASTLNISKDKAKRLMDQVRTIVSNYLAGGEE